MRRKLYSKRSKPVQIALTVFLLSKFLHLIKLVTILSSDVAEYLSLNPTIQANYPEPGQFKSDCLGVSVQYCTLIILNMVALFLSRRCCDKNWFAGVIPWLLTAMQLCELPFRPVLPVWYSVLLCIWLFSSIYFLTLEVLQTLYQAVPIFVLLLIGLPARMVATLHAEFQQSESYVYLALFSVLSIVACLNLTIGWVGGR